MSRGYTAFPYPQENVLRYIAHCGGKVTISSDSHSPDTIAYKFAESKNYAKACGIDKLWHLTQPHVFSVRV